EARRAGQQGLKVGPSEAAEGVHPDAAPVGVGGDEHLQCGRCVSIGPVWLHHRKVIHPYPQQVGLRGALGRWACGDAPRLGRGSRQEKGSPRRLWQGSALGRGKAPRGQGERREHRRWPSTRSGPVQDAHRMRSRLGGRRAVNGERECWSAVGHHGRLHPPAHAWKNVVAPDGSARMRREDEERASSISRRRMLQLGATGTALLALRVDTHPAAAAHAGVGAGPRFTLQEGTVEELQRRMMKGAETARSITEKYLDRIASVDGQLRSVLETNPDALAQADALDAERKAGKVRSALHGIPVLLKDNIATKDRMHTTAGSMALIE